MSYSCFIIINYSSSHFLPCTAVFTVMTAIIITVTLIVIKLKTKKQFSINFMSNVEMEKCEAYSTAECSVQWPHFYDTSIYNEINENIYDN